MYTAERINNQPPYDILHLSHVFQPIYKLQNHSTHGFECLIRSTETPNPELLFSMAKDGNKLYDLDVYSISRGIQTFNHFQRDKWNSLEISVNIFPSTLLNNQFLWELESIMRNSSLSPSQIVLEINEAETLSDLSSLHKATSHLQNIGFKIALDDLGKGQSSLRTAIELEPDIVKIDRYFCHGIDQSPKKQRLLSSILTFFKEEGVSVTVEGIETASELVVIQQMDVQFGQGYYLGRPRPLVK